MCTHKYSRVVMLPRADGMEPLSWSSTNLLMWMFQIQKMYYETFTSRKMKNIASNLHVHILQARYLSKAATTNPFKGTWIIIFDPAA